MFPWFFIIFEVLFCCLCIWRSNHLLLAFIGRFQERNASFSSVRTWGFLSPFLCLLLPCIFVFFGKKYLRTSAFLWACKARPVADNLLFAFSGWYWIQVYGPASQTYRIRSAYCTCSLALTAIESMHRKLATGRGCIWVSTWEYWESLWASWPGLQSGQPPMVHEWASSWSPWNGF